MIAPAQADGVVTVSAANPLPSNQAIVKPEAPTAEQKLNAQIKDFVLKLATELNGCESNPKSNFYDRPHVLGAVAVVAFASSGGIAAGASKATGILAANLFRHIETLQTRFELPGLLRALTVPAVFKELGISSTQVWPENLSFPDWSTKPISFLPAPAVAKPVNSPSLDSGSSSGETAAASNAAKIEKCSREAAGWLRERVSKSYVELKQFSELLDKAKKKEAIDAKLVPGPTALKNTFFWQGFASCQGNTAALIKMFPEDRKYVEHQLALKQEKFGVPIDATIFALAFEKQKPKLCPLKILPNVVKLAEFEAQRLELEKK